MGNNAEMDFYTQSESKICERSQMTAKAGWLHFVYKWKDTVKHTILCALYYFHSEIFSNYRFNILYCTEYFV